MVVHEFQSVLMCFYHTSTVIEYDKMKEKKKDVLEIYSCINNDISICMVSFKQIWGGGGLGGVWLRS